jgi:DNA-binding FadR family transcriptional regulator
MRSKTLRPEQTAVRRIAGQIAREIAGGAIPAGANLPPIRDLARRFHVNVGTIQRAVAGLEAMALVSVKQGSGVVVQDVESLGGFDLWPLLLSANRGNTEKAVKLVADALEVRRVLAVHLVRKVSELENYDRSALAACIERFADRVISRDQDLEELLRVEHRIIRCLLAQVDQSAMSAILNGVESTILATPQLLEAIYENPERNLNGWREFLSALDRSRDREFLIHSLLTILETFDRHVIERFRAHLCRDFQ